MTYIEHPVRLIAQPDRTTCWAASTAMMTRSTVAAVKARTPKDMIASDGGLLNSSGNDQAVVTGRQTESDRIHQEVKPRQSPGLSQIQFRYFVRLDTLNRMKDADLLIAERFVECAQAKATDRFAFRLGDRLRAEYDEALSARSNCRPSLKRICLPPPNPVESST
ncbi:MAG: hypothetical protein GY926_19265 [bacterium]|nr:hypothetical protein [bacterium]